MSIINKSIEIDIMEFNHEMALLEDAFLISEYEGNSYFTEAGDSTDNFLQKAVKKVKEFIQNIISKLEEKFSNKKLAEKQKAFEIECQKDPSKRNKKVKVRINDKMYTLSKKAMNDLMKCKTKEEVEKYMEDYRKKREKIIVASVVTISAGSLFAFLGTKLSKTTKQLNSLQQEYENCVKIVEEQNKLIRKDNEVIKSQKDLLKTYEKSEKIKNSQISDLKHNNELLDSKVKKYNNEDIILSMALQRSGNKASLARRKITNNQNLTTEDTAYIIKKLNEIMKEAVEFCGAEFDGVE